MPTTGFNHLCSQSPYFESYLSSSYFKRPIYLLVGKLLIFVAPAPHVPDKNPQKNIAQLTTASIGPCLNQLSIFWLWNLVFRTVFHVFFPWFHGFSHLKWSPRHQRLCTALHSRPAEQQALATWTAPGGLDVSIPTCLMDVIIHISYSGSCYRLPSGKLT